MTKEERKREIYSITIHITAVRSSSNVRIAFVVAIFLLSLSLSQSLALSYSNNVVWPSFQSTLSLSHSNYAPVSTTY